MSPVDERRGVAEAPEVDDRPVDEDEAVDISAEEDWMAVAAALCCTLVR